MRMLAFFETDLKDLKRGDTFVYDGVKWVVIAYVDCNTISALRHTE